MKLSVYDRIQAIIRHPQYLEDYKYIRKLIKDKPSSYGLNPRYTKFENDWRISFPLNPEEVRNLPREVFVSHQDHTKTLKASANILKYVQMFPSPVISLSDDTWEVRLRNVHIGGGLLGNRKETARKIRTKKIDFNRLLKELDFSKDLRDGRYLTLRIDLWATKGEIRREIERNMDFYRKVAKSPKDRRRESTYCDPWVVYDMNKKGKNPLRIAKDIFGFKENPTYCPTAKARYEVVNAALEKAHKMIEEVTPTR